MSRSFRSTTLQHSCTVAVKTTINSILPRRAYKALLGLCMHF
nr:MAG TPA: hypothetical protein [Caudoviricetes sp.]